MSKKMRSTALKAVFCIIAAVMVVGMAGTNVFALDRYIITCITDGGSPYPPSTEVKFNAFYKNNDAYLLTEDLASQAVPIDSLINNWNKGCPTGPGQCKTSGGNWPEVLANGDPYVIWVTRTTNGRAGSGTGAYAASDSYTTPGTLSSRLTLLDGNALPTPAFGGSAGNGIVMLTWEAVTGADSYVIYRRTKDAPKGTNNWICYSKLYTASAAGDYVDTTIVNENNYYYLIIAKDGTARMSAHSDEIQLFPTAGAKPIVTSVSPKTANNATPTVVTIRGSGFTGATLVSVEGASSNACTITPGWLDYQMTVTIPSGILPTGAYNIVVTNTNNGFSSPIGPASAITITESTDPPTAPTNFHVTGKDATSVSYAWNDNAGNEDNYALFTAGGTTPISVLYPAGTTSTTERNLMPNTSYPRRVGAMNTHGNGYSDPLTTYTLALDPYNLRAGAANASTIILTWEASNGGSGSEPSKYAVWRALEVSGSPGPFTNIAPNVTAKTYTDASCGAMTKYYYKVIGYNGSNDLTNYSNVTNETTPSGPPAAPLMSTLSKGNSTSSIQWSIVDNSNNEDYFAVFDGVTQKSGLIPTTDKVGTGSIVSTIEYTLSGPNVAYTRSAKAYNGAFGPASGTLTRSTLANSPFSPTATALSTKRARITWSITGSVNGFRVERSNSDSPWSTTYSFDATSSPTDDATLSGTKWYRVKSYNTDKDLNPAASIAVSVTAASPIPAPSNVEGKSPTTTTITWACTDEAADEAGYKLMNGSVTVCALGSYTGTGLTVSTVEGGLTPCKSYTRTFSVYRLYDDVTLSTSAVKSTLPVVPITPTTNGKSPSSITFNLIANGNDTAGLQYVIETATVPGGPWTTLEAAYPGTNTTYTHSGLSASSSHYYRVYAKNPEGVRSGVSGNLAEMTLGAGDDGQAPRFDQIKVNQRAFIESTTLSSLLNTLEVTVTDLPTLGCIGVDVVITTIDAAQTYKQTVAMTGPYPGTIYSGVWRGTFNFASMPPEKGSTTHSVTIYARDKNNNVATQTINALLTPGIQLVDVPLNYPNPFYPLSSNATYRTTMIQYKLTDDAAIVIEIYNTEGVRVRKWDFTKGETGHSKAGVNSVSWDGYSSGKVVGNGMYIYKIYTRSGGKLVNIGTGKLVIWPR